MRSVAAVVPSVRNQDWSSVKPIHKSVYLTLDNIGIRAKEKLLCPHIPYLGLVVVIGETVQSLSLLSEKFVL